MMLSPIEKLTSELTKLGSSMTPQTVATWQMEQIRKVLAIAKEKSYFYSQKFAGIDISKIKTPQDMQFLPFTTPADIKTSPDSFLCVPARYISRIRTLKTSGSTAAPKRIFFTENDTQRTVRFFSHGMTTFTSPGDSVMIAMSDDSTDSIASLLKNGVEQMGASAKIHGAIKDIDSAVEDARDADVIVGLPSEIRYLCTNCPKLRPKAVLLSADYVSQSIIGSLQQTWHCDVYTHYGLTETCYGCAVQCAGFEAQHIRHEEDYIEIIDPLTGAVLPAGERGEIVITAFANEAMPLVRYRTGDMSSIVDTPCACGGVLPRLGKVYGRIVAENTTVKEVPCIETLEEIVYAIPQVSNFKAQMEDGVLAIAVNATSPLDTDTIAEKIRGVYPGIRVSVFMQDVDHAILAGGKSRIFVHGE
jgi:phenylacetate-CoA ligase